MTLGRARLAIGQGVSLWVLEVPDGFGQPDSHAHHAIQISLCLSGTMTLECGARQFDDPALLVAADRVHALDGSGVLVLVFLDPESPQGRAVTALLPSGQGAVALDAGRIRPHLSHLAAAFTADLGEEDLLAAGRAAVAALVDRDRQESIDPRIALVVDRAMSGLDGPLELSRLGQGINLSASRLRHLFVEQTGLPFKSYVLWLRLNRALQVYTRGQSLTEAAHAAGFADSAHLSRTFRRTFGLPATTLTRF